MRTWTSRARDTGCCDPVLGADRAVRGCAADRSGGAHHRQLLPRLHPAPGHQPCPAAHWRQPVLTGATIRPHATTHATYMWCTATTVGACARCHLHCPSGKRFTDVVRIAAGAIQHAVRAADSTHGGGGRVSRAQSVGRAGVAGAGARPCDARHAHPRRGHPHQQVRTTAALHCPGLVGAGSLLGGRW